MKIQVMSASVEMTKDNNGTQWTIGIDGELPEILFREMMISIIRALSDYLRDRGWEHDEDCDLPES